MVTGNTVFSGYVLPKQEKMRKVVEVLMFDL